MPLPLLAYWDIRCLAESIRLMLHYLEITFEDKRYPTGDAPDYARPEWKKEKFNLGLDFPNLPYWIDGDVKLTESWAIIKHLARKSKILYPQTVKEICQCDMLQRVIEQFRYKFIDMCYSKTNEEFSKKKAEFLPYLNLELNKFEKSIGENKWLTGNKLLYVDFVLCEALDEIRIFMPKFLSKYSSIKKYLDAFDNLEQITKYRLSDFYHPLPLHSKYAYYGGELTAKPEIL